MTDFVWLLVPACLLGFALFWCLICLLIAQMGGWGALAGEFRTAETPPGPRFFLQAAELNGSRYKGCLTIGLTDTGVHLSVMTLFRPGHPPLLVPWSRFGPIVPTKSLWRTGYATTIRLRSRETVSLTVYSQQVADALAYGIARATSPVSAHTPE